MFDAEINLRKCRPDIEGNYILYYTIPIIQRILGESWNKQIFRKYLRGYGYKMQISHNRNDVVIIKFQQ
jgi:hypothetical protein